MTIRNQSVFTCISASNHSKLNRVDHDYYATDPKAIDLLLEQEDFNPHIWECACGEGHLSKALEKHGYKVRSTDLILRGYVAGLIPRDVARRKANMITREIERIGQQKDGNDGTL